MFSVYFIFPGFVYLFYWVYSIFLVLVILVSIWSCSCFGLVCVLFVCLSPVFLPQSCLCVHLRLIVCSLYFLFYCGSLLSLYSCSVLLLQCLVCLISASCVSQVSKTSKMLWFRGKKYLDLDLVIVKIYEVNIEDVGKHTQKNNNSNISDKESHCL